MIRRAGDRGLASPPGGVRRFAADGGQLCEGNRNTALHMMAGNAPWHDVASVTCYRDNLLKAAEVTAEAGVGLAIEPINSRDMPGYFLNSFDRALQLIADAGRPNVRLQFDVYHRQTLHGDVIMALGRLVASIGHIQVAELPARNEPTTGELNDRAIIAEIDAIGYQGYVGCEYRPAGITEEGLGWLRSL
jgi:2-dehydrotetronate isomerase